MAHRIAYAFGVGTLAAHEVVLHSCDNPNCCNPAHLAKGTLSDNTQDMLAKNRHFTPWRGEAASHAKLTENTVREIRASPLGCRRLAKLYNVSSAAIRAAKRGKSWRHVT